MLGQGGFGLVYLAYDEQLHRRVAVKVPHARLISKPEDAEAYLTEARTVANLDHPRIVPVYDVGTFSVLSSLPLTIRRPSGLNATLRRPLVCPLSVSGPAPFREPLYCYVPPRESAR